MYSMLGVNVVTCAVSVEGIIGFDLGRTVEKRVEELCDDIVEWVEGKEDDGRERLLMFHTFSNTGWLGYVLRFYKTRVGLLFSFDATHN